MIDKNTYVCSIYFLTITIMYPLKFKPIFKSTIWGGR